MRFSIRYRFVTALVAVAISTASAAEAQLTGTAQAARQSDGRVTMCDYVRELTFLSRDERPVRPVTENAAVRIEGTWVGGILRPEGPTPVSMKLESRGGTLSGTFQLSGGDAVEISKGSISEGDVFFEVAVGRGEFLQFSGRIDGQTLRLNIESSEGSDGVSLVQAVRN